MGLNLKQPEKGGECEIDGRMKELDIIRGITIILVVSSHVGLPDSINHVLATFRIPLFFMASGYLFSNTKYVRNFNTLFESKFFGLLIPYCSACLLFYSLWLLRRFIEKKSEYTWYDPIWGIFYGNGEGLVFNMPLWFLVCLFCLQVIFGVSLGYLQRYSWKVQSFFYVSLGFIGFAVAHFVHLPWGLDIAMVVIPFFFIGNLLKEHKTLFKMKFSMVMIAIFCIVFIVSCAVNAPINVNSRVYNNLLLFYAGGISGSILVWEFTKLISNKIVLVNFFSAIGKESLSILIFHMGASYILRLTLISLGVGPFYMDWLVYTVGAVLISFIIGKVIKEFPLLNFLFNGKKLQPLQSVILKSN